MTKRDYIPESDGDFNVWQRNLLAYLNPHATGWNIPQAALDNIASLRAIFEQKYAIAMNPETRTQISVRIKNESRRDYEKALRQLVKGYITYNPSLTTEDRSSMGLPIHKSTRTPAPVPTTFPEFEIDSSKIRNITVHFRSRGSRRRAKPAGVHCAYIRWLISPTPPTTLKEMVHVTTETRTPLTLQFEEDQRGKTIYICLCWENTRGETGPWSDIVSAIIP